MGYHQVTGAHSMMVKNNASLEHSDDISSAIIDLKRFLLSYLMNILWTEPL